MRDKYGRFTKDSRPERRINDGLTNAMRYYYRHRKEILTNQRNHPEHKRIINQKYRIANNYINNKSRTPEQRRARLQAWRLIPLKSYCEFGGCHSTKNLQRAHMDYDYPLEVLTFCAIHHNLIDRLYGLYDLILGGGW